MSSNYFEKHSIRTLAMRFKGLASRNTIVRWIRENKLRPEMTDKTPAPYLFKRSLLDDVGKLLQEAHERRVKRLTKGETEFRALRDKVRADCLQTLLHNEAAGFSKKPHLVKFESDPALRDDHAIGIKTPIANSSSSYRLGNCNLGEKGDKNKK
jgi:hypothetical protein